MPEGSELTIRWAGASGCRSYSPSREAHDLSEGSSRPRYKNSMMAMTMGQDALKQMMVSTGTYCNYQTENVRRAGAMH